MKVCLITATKGRHALLERSVRFSLDQTYHDIVHLIYNNSEIDQRLNNNLLTGKYILVNNHIDKVTNLPYTNLGAIYRDALSYIPEDVEVITHFDDDDVFLPNHVHEGVKGLIKGRKTAYKPQKSFYKTRKGISLMNNVLEPSIFVKKEHVMKYGYSKTSTPQHLQWLQPLIDSGDIFEDKDGLPTLIYDWSHDIPTYKASGNHKNPDNFSNFEKASSDHGDRIITPISAIKAQIYYKPTDEITRKLNISAGRV